MTIAFPGRGMYIPLLCFCNCSGRFCVNITHFVDEQRLMFGGCTGDLLGICVLAPCEVKDLPRSSRR